MKCMTLDTKSFIEGKEWINRKYGQLCLETDKDLRRLLRIRCLPAGRACSQKVCVSVTNMEKGCTAIKGLPERVLVFYNNAKKLYRLDIMDL